MEQEDKGEQLYSREEFEKYSEDLFGVKPEVLAGALYGREQREFSLGEMRDLINNFMQRKVHG